MYEWRYLDNNYTENPDFIFNQPEYREASILITGDNFGAGSSRNMQLGLWLIMGLKLL